MKKILATLFILFFAVNAYAAAFTSTQTGNWNDGGTWGNTSPGAKGTDWPGNTGDTANIATTHIVTYNVSETNELGQMDIVGKLTFDAGADRKLTFGHVDLNIANGGELEIGTSGTNFAVAYTAEVLWNTTGDNQEGLIIANGGKLTVYGASTYCSDYEDTLANDAENTDGDTSIKTVTDMSAIWHTGDEITIKVENAGDSTSFKDAIKKAVIQSMTGTTIVLDISITAAAGVGDTWVSPVVNVTRNVQFGKLNADTACGDGSTHYNTNRPKFYDTNADGNDNCVFSYAMVTGFHSIDSDHDFQFLESTNRNNYYGFNHGTGHTVSGNVYSSNYGLYYGTSHTVSGNVYSNNRGFQYGTSHTVSGNVYSSYYGFHYGTSHTVSGNVYSNYRGFQYGTGHTVSGNVYSNNHGFDYGTGHTVSGNVYSNNHGFYYGTGHTVSSRIGYNGSDVTFPNTTSDFHTDGYNVHTLLNVKLPLAGLNVRRNQNYFLTRVICEHHDRSKGAQKIYDNTGDVVKTACDGTGDAPSVDPDAGNGYCVELSNIQSLCNSTNPLEAWEPYQYRIWATTGVAKTYTFKVQTTYSGITAGNLKLTAKYLDEGSGGHLAESTNAPAINVRANDTDWTQTLAVTITPAQTGWITFTIKLMEYQAGDEVYIWPVAGIT